MKRYGTGKAGQYSKSEATKRFNGILNRIIGVTAVGMLVLGIAVGYAAFPFVFLLLPWTRKVPVAVYWCTVLGIEAIALTLVTGLYRAFKAPLDKLAIERVRHLRGGQTEALVAAMLQGLDDRWHLFNGIAMKGGGDIDHVLVGPGGLFSISTKSYRGIYTRSADGKVQLNGAANADVMEAQRLAMTLRHWLEARLQSNHTVKMIPFVQPVLVVPFAYVDFPSRVSNVWVMDEAELFDIAYESKAVMKKPTVDGCVQIFKELTGWQEYSKAEPKIDGDAITITKP